MNKYSVERRAIFAGTLAKAIDPGASGPVLSHLSEFVMPGIKTLPDKLFSKENAAAIAHMLFNNPTTDDVHRALMSLGQQVALVDPVKNLGPMPDWQLQRILDDNSDIERDWLKPREERHQPILRDWLENRNGDLLPVLQSRAERRKDVAADWSDPGKVRSSAAKLEGHPFGLTMGRMLFALVLKHAPQNACWVPPQYHHAVPVG